MRALHLCISIEFPLSVKGASVTKQEARYHCTDAVAITQYGETPKMFGILFREH